MRVRTNEAIDLEPARGVDWKAIDTALRTIVQRRGALDALEAKWIREALRVRIWREVGCVTMAEYLERRLGYAPRTAHDRVRVAVALEELPKLAAALEGGLPHSAVRELTRVCTNENEQKWLDKVRGKTVHEIEGMVSGRARGADPEDPPNPNLVGRTLPFEGVRPATEALVRDARRMLQEQRGGGEVLSDDDVLASFARIVLEGGGSMERTKAPYQIALTMCECCGRGWQESGGRKYELSKADLERACCDAERIGRVDTGVPERAKQDVPPSTRRLVHRRARGRCEVPGCRSTRCLEIHHIVPRSLGGTHDPDNLILLCDGCHASHHRGLIQISGTASALVVTRKYEIAYDVPSNDEIDASAHVGTNVGHDPDRHRRHSIDEASSAARVHEQSAHVGTNGGHEAERSATEVTRPSPERGARFERERIRSEARTALVCLGFRSREAGKAVDFAIRRGHETLETVIREALRSCAPPSRA